MAHTSLAVTERPPITTNHTTVPPSPEASERRAYSPEEEQRITQLLPLAELMDQYPEVAERFSVMKWLTMGASDRDERFAGRHPWPERQLHGETYVYSVPVVAGILLQTDPYTQETRYSALSVMKDNWKNDPDAWLVTQLDLHSGKSQQIPVMDVRVDAKHQANIILQPDNYANMPPLSRPDPRVTPLRDLRRIDAQLDADYHAAPTATYYNSHRRPGAIVDIELLGEALRRTMGERLDREVFAGLEDVTSSWYITYPKDTIENSPFDNPDTAGLARSALRTMGITR